MPGPNRERAPQEESVWAIRENRFPLWFAFCSFAHLLPHFCTSCRGQLYTHSTHRVSTAPALSCLTLALKSSPQLDAVSTTSALVPLLPVRSAPNTPADSGRVPPSCCKCLSLHTHLDAALNNPAVRVHPLTGCVVSHTHHPCLQTPLRCTICPQKSLSHTLPHKQLVFRHPPPRLHPPPPGLVVPHLWGADNYRPHGISSLDGDSYPPHAAGRAGCGRNGKQFSLLLELGCVVLSWAVRRLLWPDVCFAATGEFL